MICFSSSYLQELIVGKSSCNEMQPRCWRWSNNDLFRNTFLLEFICPRRSKRSIFLFRSVDPITGRRFRIRWTYLFGKFWSVLPEFCVANYGLLCWIASWILLLESHHAIGENFNVIAYRGIWATCASGDKANSNESLYPNCKTRSGESVGRSHCLIRFP